MRFIAKSPSAARPAWQARAARTSIYPCADLALVYGKDSALSPFRRVFWAFLVGLDDPKIRPTRFCQGLSLGPAPRRNPGMVARQQDVGDRAAFELLRAGILRVFQ